MDPRTRHYLISATEILRSLASSSQFQRQLRRKQLDDLHTASRLLDLLLIEASTAPTAAGDYWRSVHSLLPKIEDAIEETADTEEIRLSVARLKEFNCESCLASLDEFLQVGAELQKGLCHLDDPAIHQHALALLKSDSDYAEKLFSAGLAAAGPADSDGGGSPVNVREYDERALLKFVADQFPGNRGARIEKSGFIAGGHSKFSMAIELSGVSNIPNRMILRGDAEGMFSGADVASEYRLHRELFALGINVPEPLAVEETGKVFGSPFMLSEWVDGSIIGHMFMLPAPDEKVLVDVARNLAAIHAIPPDTFGDWLDNANASASHKFLTWLELGYRDLGQSDLHSATFETAFAWLRRNATRNDLAPRTLVHGDYGLNNMLVRNREVKAVVDWEFAHLGNPAYDLAYFYFMAQALGSWELFLESYAGMGVPLPEEDQLNYCMLLAATRLGVQCAQAHSAFNAGLSTSATARVVSNQYVNESILRISSVLDRVL